MVGSMLALPAIDRTGTPLNWKRCTVQPSVAAHLGAPVAAISPNTNEVTPAVGEQSAGVRRPYYTTTFESN